MPLQMTERLIREALMVLSYSVPSSSSYRALCRRFLAQRGIPA